MNIEELWTKSGSNTKDRLWVWMSSIKYEEMNLYFNKYYKYYNEHSRFLGTFVYDWLIRILFKWQWIVR